MSKILPNSERSIPIEERQFSTDFRVCKEVDLKLGFFCRAFVGFTLRDLR